MTVEPLPCTGPSLMIPLPNSFAGHPGLSPSRHKFLKLEDNLLCELVERFGEKNWTVIAQFMKRRSARQCRERYKNYLSPAVSNRPWSEAEDDLLTAKVSELGQKWAKIAVFFQGRSDVNLKNHWAALTLKNERLQRFAAAKASTEETIFVPQVPQLTPADDDWWAVPQTAFTERFRVHDLIDDF
jgi:hypothetical protein